MLPHLCFALSFLPPSDAERRELARLYPRTDARWHQKMDRASVVVTVRDAGQLVAAGIVHDSIVAPTELMDAAELGCMSVDSRYRRMGIRQHVSSLRLAHALRVGANPITVVYAGNPASWAFYERSELWTLEREYEHEQRRLFIYQSTAHARQWVRLLPQAAGLALDPRRMQLPVVAQTDTAGLEHPGMLVRPSAAAAPAGQGTPRGTQPRHGLKTVAG
ncbi:hypothetical protein OK351_13465 [Glutamicibacter sp. MNS18]|uniref:GNAT family N-acetyltransferase n=1 Tax=Glutamicibacter sp. MNS18 TaxID=2989817 RepID=UPI002236A4C2|nr:GNAT family N-acetyltransferase [Glutamicibacter sp. MNS18]MCW4466504.1 hypothetical protein [Glutamicibacter sp. MNS18]